MKATHLHAWPIVVSEKDIITYSSKPTRRKKPGVIKALQPLTPPDEATIRRLNELAASKPFCTHQKVKRFDLL
jgi:hypothetical protein